MRDDIRKLLYAVYLVLEGSVHVNERDGYMLLEAWISSHTPDLLSWRKAFLDLDEETVMENVMLVCEERLQQIRSQ